MKSMKPSPPIIVEPVYEHGQAVAIHGHQAGADVAVFRLRAGKPEQIGQGQAPKTYPVFNVWVQQLELGDRIFAVQKCQVNGQLTESPNPPQKLVTATALPHGGPPKPQVRTPLYLCAREIRVEKILNGAIVETYHNGVRQFRQAAGCPNMVYSIAKLEPGDVVYARQYFPGHPPAKSDEESPDPYTEKQLPAPRIRTPLIQCAPSFEVEGLEMGAEFFIRDVHDVQNIHDPESGQLIAHQVAEAPLTSVDAGEGARPTWKLVASQQLCGKADLSPPSDPPVPVESVDKLKEYPPRILGQPKPGGPADIVVEGVHESTIRIVARGEDANGQEINIDIGGGTCYGRTTFRLDSLPGDKPIQPIQSFDCQGKVWEASGYPVWPIARFLEFPADEAKIIELTNAARQAHSKCAPLQPDPKLMKVARDHSQDLASHHPDLYTATPPGVKPNPGHYGSSAATLTSGQRIAMAISSPGDTAENVCCPSPSVQTAQEAFDKWWNSEGHRNNILDCKYKYIGVGIAQIPGSQVPGGAHYYYTQVFCAKV